MWKITKYLILFSVLGSMEVRIQALEHGDKAIEPTVTASASTNSASTNSAFIPPFIGWGRSGYYNGNGASASWDQSGGYYNGNGASASWDKSGGYYNGNGVSASWKW